MRLLQVAVAARRVARQFGVPWWQPLVAVVVATATYDPKPLQPYGIAVPWGHDPVGVFLDQVRRYG